MGLIGFFKSVFHIDRPIPGCVELSNSPAVYREDVICIDIPLVQLPITEQITKPVLIKEAAVERYIECDQATGETRLCVRELEAEYEDVTYTIITGYNTIQNAEVRFITKLVKISDGDVLESCSVTP